MTRVDHPVKIYLFGSFEMQRGDRKLRAADWPRKKAAALMKRLALEKRLLKEQAIEFLWPGSNPASAHNNLYKTIYVLRKTLDKWLGAGTAAVIVGFEDGVLTLEPGVWVDVQEFEAVCAAVGSDRRTNEEVLVRGLDLYRGELLPDERYADWTAQPRDEFFRCQREVRLRLAGIHRRRQDFPASVGYLEPLLASDPADEIVHRELMLLYALSGQRSRALRQYQKCVQALQEEVGVVPTEETTALHAQIAAGEALVRDEQQNIPALIPVPPEQDRPPPLFVGRERELNRLFSGLSDAEAGKGGIFFIRGEAGQGKSSLLAHFARQAAAERSDLVIAAGTCHALAGISDPYQPFRDLLAMLLGDWQRPWFGGEITADQARRLVNAAPLAAAAVRITSPGLSGILLSEDDRALPEPGLAYRQHPEQIFDQVAQLLRHICTRHTLLLVFDDLQWIDAPSASLLFALSRQLANQPIFILAAYRPDEVVRSGESVHPLAPVVQELVRQRGEITIDLDVSSPAEARQFIDAVLDSEPNQLGAAFREALYQRTKGQPLFTVELLRSLQEQGSLVIDESGKWMASDLTWAILPARVEAVIARRIDSLPSELHSLLEAAAIEGETFSPAVLAQVLKIDERELVHTLSRDLEQRHRLVREQGAWHLGRISLSRFQFRHHLFQQYLYQQLGSAARRIMHRETAEAYEALGADAAELLAVTLARHFLAAGEPIRAAPYLDRAGDEARNRAALDEAVTSYSMAIEYWSGSVDGRAKTLQKLGETFLAQGDPARAMTCWQEADRDYQIAGNITGRGAVQRLMGRAFWEQGVREKALEHYHQALSLLETGTETPELARAVSAAAQMYFLADDYDSARTWGERALDMARRLRVEDVHCHALITVGGVLAVQADAERGLAMIAESQERAEALALTHDACRAYTMWADTLLQLEQNEAAHNIYERMLSYAVKVRAKMFEGVALIQLGYLEWWAGWWRKGLHRRQAVLEWMASAPGESMAKVWASTYLGWMFNDLGQPDQARQALTEYTALARLAVEPQTTVPHLGQLLRSEPKSGRAAELAQEILTQIEKAPNYRYEILAPLRTATLWRLQVSPGREDLRLMEKVHRQMHNQQSAACLEEIQAEANALQKEWQQAIKHYARAAQLWDGLGRPYDLLRPLIALAKVYGEEPGAVQPEGSSLGEIKERSSLIVQRLLAELDEPALKHSFLRTPLAQAVIQLRMGEKE
jgi:DNA-binding SARP family transcriptional activator/tetratricopeptide (TPR) repeat protein